MTPEGKTTKRIREWLKERRRMGDPVWWMKLHGGPMGKTGAPDWHILWEGEAFYIEVKRPGEKPSPLQAIRMKEIRRAGGEAFVVDSFEQFLDLMGAPKSERNEIW